MATPQPPFRSKCSQRPAPQRTVRTARRSHGLRLQPSTCVQKTWVEMRSNESKKGEQALTEPGLEPGISASVERRLIQLGHTAVPGE